MKTEAQLLVDADAALEQQEHHDGYEAHEHSPTAVLVIDVYGSGRHARWPTVRFLDLLDPLWRAPEEEGLSYALGLCREARERGRPTKLVSVFLHGIMRSPLGSDTPLTTGRTPTEPAFQRMRESVPVRDDTEIRGSLINSDFSELEQRVLDNAERDDE